MTSKRDLVGYARCALATVRKALTGKPEVPEEASYSELINDNNHQRFESALEQGLILMSATIASSGVNCV